ncbi:phospholipase D-like domain-containing protein [Sorangium sp. So ce362]|uniref:phospholipase D-like domain-containing protein n=1 Tax=Sorangium sp. So ce362 TaxID=3133303 RepID=UPI003F617834
MMSRIAPRTLVAAWELARSRALDVFTPGVMRALPGLPGWSALGLPAEALDHTPSVTLLEALRALALRERSGVKSHDTTVELVATLPTPDRSVLSTSDVVRTLLEGAQQSILIVGFEITEPSLYRLLARRGLDQLHVTVVGDRERGSARQFRRSWPAAARPLRALENVEPAMQIPAMLHAKAIVADAHVALVGSANFTAGGLRNNIEFGVRATGPLVQAIVRTVERLEREGWLVTARP